MNLRLAYIWDQTKSSYWFIPGLMALAATLLAVGMIAADRRVGPAGVGAWPVLWTGGAEGARLLLGTVAGSTITVAGTVFSIAIVALTLASSQFGPRLLRNFMRDTGNQVTLGTFLATFVYCLLVLRTVRSGDEGLFVPHLSVSTALVLALVSVVVLIYYIHHVSVSIHADEVIAMVGVDLEEAIASFFPPDDAPHRPPDGVPPPDLTAGPAASIPADASGYLQGIDADDLVDLAVAHDLFIRVAYRPGKFVIRGTPVAHAWPADRVDAAVLARVRDACVLGETRTPFQDVEYAINQLVEIATRALSPAINDPFTAVTCIDWLGEAMCELARRPVPPVLRRDAAGRPRLQMPLLRFAGLADAAFNPIRQYGASSPMVLIRLLETIVAVAKFTETPEQRDVLLRHAEMVRRASAAFAEQEDRKDLCERYEAALRGLNDAALPASAT